MVDYYGNNLTPLVKPKVDAGLPVKLNRKCVSITELLQQPPKAIEDHGAVLRWYNPEVDRMSVRSYLIKLAEDFRDIRPPYEHQRIIPIAPGYELYRWEGQVQVIKQAKYSDILNIKPNLSVPPSQRLRRGGPRILYQLPPRELEDRVRVIHLPPIEKDQFFNPPTSSVALASPRWLKRPRAKVPPTRSLSRTQSFNGYTYPILTPPPSPDTTSHARGLAAGPSRSESQSAANAQRKTIPLRRPLARIPIQAPLPRRAPLVGAQPLLNNDALGVPSPLEAFPGPAEDECEDGTPIEMDIEMDGSHLVPMRSENVPMKITYPPIPRGCITPPPSTSPSPQLKSYHKEYPPRAFSPGPSWLHKQKETVQISREGLRRDLSDAQKELAEMLYEVAVAEEELKKAGKETKELVETMRDAIGPGFDFNRLLEQARKAARGDVNANNGAVDDNQRTGGLKVHVARKLPRTKPLLHPAITSLVGSPLQQILPAVRGMGNVAPVHVGMVRTNLGPVARRQREAEEAQARAALEHPPLTSLPTPVSPSEQHSPTTATAPSSPIQTASIGSGPGPSTTIPASHPSVDDDSDDELEYVDELVRNPSEPRSSPAEGEGPADHQEHTKSSGPSRTVETSSLRQEVNDANALDPGPSQPTFTPLASSSQYTRTGDWDATYGGDPESETWLLPNSNFDNDFHVHTLDHWKWGRPVPKDDPAAKGAGPDQRAVYLPPPGYSEMIHSSRYRGQKRKREEPESSDDDSIPADILTKKRAKILMKDWNRGWSLEDTNRIAHKALPTSESEAIFTNLSSGFSSSDSGDSDSEMGDDPDGGREGHRQNTFQPPAAKATPFVRLHLADNSSDADSEYQADVEMSDSEPSPADDVEEPYIPSLNHPPNEQSVLQSFFDRTDQEVDARSAWSQPPPHPYTLQPSLLVPPPAPAPGPSRGLRRANEMILPNQHGQPDIWKWDQGPEFEQRMKLFEASLPKRDPQIRPAPHPLHWNHDDYIAEFEGIHWDARDAGWSRELILVDAEEEDEEIEEIEESDFLGKAKGT